MHTTSSVGYVLKFWRLNWALAKNFGEYPTGGSEILLFLTSSQYTDMLWAISSIVIAKATVEIISEKRNEDATFSLAEMLWQQCLLINLTPNCSGVHKIWHEESRWTKHTLLSSRSGIPFRELNFSDNLHEIGMGRDSIPYGEELGRAFTGLQGDSAPDINYFNKNKNRFRDASPYMRGLEQRDEECLQTKPQHHDPTGAAASTASCLCLRACRSCSETQTGSGAGGSSDRAAPGEHTEHTQVQKVCAATAPVLWADLTVLSVHNTFATINKNIQKYKTV